MRIFVLGYLGAKQYDEALKIASEVNSEPRISEAINNLSKYQEEINTAKNKAPFEVLDMNKEIERLDGRSLIKICMGHGEHAIRNCEYEVLSKLVNPDFQIGMAKNEVYPENLVVACGDGIVLDEQCYEIIKSQPRVIIDKDLEEMWNNAKGDTTIPYAYMLMGTEEEKYARFCENYERRSYLYEELK